MNLSTNTHFWKAFSITLKKCGWDQEVITAVIYMTRMRIMSGYYV